MEHEEREQKNLQISPEQPPQLEDRRIERGKEREKGRIEQGKEEENKGAGKAKERNKWRIEGKEGKRMVCNEMDDGIEDGGEQEVLRRSV